MPRFPPIEPYATGRMDVSRSYGAVIEVLKSFISSIASVSERPDIYLPL
jgi:hypothetical protein